MQTRSSLTLFTRDRKNSFACLLHLGAQGLVRKVTALRSLPFSEPLTRSFGLNLIRLAAESMSKFVAHSEVEKLVKGDTPPLQQLQLSLRLGHKQGFFDKCLTPF